MKITFKRLMLFLFMLFVIVSFQSGWNFLSKVSDKQILPDPITYRVSDKHILPDPVTFRVSDKPILPDRGGRKQLLLLATTRTGSSFVGEFFNQQRDIVAYLFEPLWHVEKAFIHDGQINLTATARVYPDVLRQLFLCNFSLLESFIKPPPVDHMTRNLFYRAASSFLCDEPVCSPVNKAKGCGACGPLNLTKASESCLQKKHMVIKLVRLRHFHILQPLAEDSSLDIKFIQLVRDPRAIVSSRFQVFPLYKNLKKWSIGEDQPLEEKDFNLVKRTCESLRVSAELGLSQPPWLQGRYMLVRYEDIVRFPIQKAAEIYQFYGMPFTPQMESWILKKSSMMTNGSFSMQNNSSTRIEKWRSKLPFKLVQAIQTICEPTMNLFGYKLVTSEKMLTDRSVSLFENKDFNIL